MNRQILQPLHQDDRLSHLRLRLHQAAKLLLAIERVQVGLLKGEPSRLDPDPSKLLQQCRAPLDLLERTQVVPLDRRCGHHIALKLLQPVELLVAVQNGKNALDLLKVLFGMAQINLLGVRIVPQDALLVVLYLELVLKAVVQNRVALELLVKILEVGLVVLVEAQRLLVISEELAADLGMANAAAGQLLVEALGVVDRIAVLEPDIFLLGLIRVLYFIKKTSVKMNIRKLHRFTLLVDPKPLIELVVLLELRANLREQRRRHWVLHLPAHLLQRLQRLISERFSSQNLKTLLRHPEPRLNHFQLVPKPIHHIMLRPQSSRPSQPIVNLLLARRKQNLVNEILLNQRLQLVLIRLVIGLLELFDQGDLLVIGG